MNGEGFAFCPIVQERLWRSTSARYLSVHYRSSDHR
jgi:hypothetical protein